MTNFTGKNIERKLKILIVGLGGIGSQLTDLVVPALNIGHISVELYLMDDDNVELHNIGHQKYQHHEIGQSKVSSLNERYSIYQNVKIIPIEEKLTENTQLEMYDIIVVSVDRDNPRKIVHSSGKAWVDLRCQGDGWMMLDSDTDSNIICSFPKNEQPVSCQLLGAIDEGNIQFGFAAVAAIGAQWVLQKIRMSHGVTTKVPRFSMGYLTHGEMRFPLGGLKSE